MLNYYGVGNNSKITLTIGGSDYSDYLENFSANYGSVDYSSGVSFITGTLVLKANSTTATNLDYRFSGSINIGEQIILSTNGIRLPVAGTLYVINVNWDLQKTLTIDMGCELGLQNSRSYKSSLLCIDYAAKFPVKDAIKSLLTTSGVTSNLNIDNIEGKLVKPLEISDSESLIQAAANLAGSQGHILYQDSQGIIQAKDLATLSEQYTINEPISDLYSYTLVSQPEALIKVLEVAYTQSDIVGLLGTTASSASFGDILVGVANSADKNTMSTTSNFTEYRKGLPLSVTTVLSYFEPSPSYLRAGTIATLKNCYSGKDSRIISRETITRSDNTEVLKEWYARKATASVPTGFTVSGTITSNRLVETWSYSQATVEIIKTTYQPIARVVPNIANRVLNSSKPAIPDVAPLSEIIAEQTFELYSAASEKSGRYTKLLTTYRAANLIQPNELLAEAASPTIPLTDVVSNGQRLVPINQVIEYGVSLPSFETFSVDPEISSVSKSFLVNSVSARGIVSQLDFGELYLPNVTRLKNIAKNYLTFNNGRVYGCNVAMSMPASERWSLVSPLALAKIREENNALAYIMDSPGVTYSDKELLFSFSGSCIGLGGDQDNYYADIISVFGLLGSNFTDNVTFGNASTTISGNNFVTFGNASRLITGA